MSSPEQSVIVQSKFVSGETLIIAMEALLTQSWVKRARIVALLNKGSTHAFVILITSRTPPQVYSDLTIERVLPIEQDFKCNISADSFKSSSVHVYNISQQ